MQRQTGSKGGGPIHMLVRGIGVGVEMATGYHEHRKQKKQAQPKDELIQSSSEETCAATTTIEDSVEDDEEDWLLDEAIAPLADGKDDTEVTSNEDLVADVMTVFQLNGNAAASSAPIETRVPLEYPVIIPQRRPRNNTRGFVRAYAPALEYSGIDQATFLRFLKNFHKSSQASPVFTYVQITAAVVGLVPSLTAMVVTTAAQIGAHAGAVAQTRSRTNTYLDRINDDLFKPAGLYAMIIKYKPVDFSKSSTQKLSSMIKVRQTDLSTDQAIAKYDRSADDEEEGRGKRRDKFRSASKSSIELPRSAPLVFPDLDDHLQQVGPETFKDKMRDGQKYMAKYLDRRGQAQYMQDHPEHYSSFAPPPSSASTTPETMKESRASANHPMYNNGLIGLVSGGKLYGLRTARRRVGIGSKRGGPIASVRRFMRQDVLYLMIVNLPSDEELEKARRELNEE